MKRGLVHVLQEEKRRISLEVICDDDIRKKTNFTGGDEDCWFGRRKGIILSNGLSALGMNWYMAKESVNTVW